MTIRIFVEQYGFFWSFTPKQFLKMAAFYIKTNQPFTYDQFGTERKRPPYKHVCRYRSEGGKWFAASPGTLLYQALDWGKEDYIQAYREVYQKMLKEEKEKKNAKK